MGAARKTTPTSERVEEVRRGFLRHSPAWAVRSSGREALLFGQDRGPRARTASLKVSRGQFLVRMGDEEPQKWPRKTTPRDLGAAVSRWFNKLPRAGPSVRERMAELKAKKAKGNMATKKRNPARAGWVQFRKVSGPKVSAPQLRAKLRREQFWVQVTDKSRAAAMALGKERDAHGRKVVKVSYWTDTPDPKDSGAWIMFTPAGLRKYPPVKGAKKKTKRNAKAPRRRNAVVRQSVRPQIKRNPARAGWQKALRDSVEGMQENVAETAADDDEASLQAEYGVDHHEDITAAQLHRRALSNVRASIVEYGVAGALDRGYLVSDSDDAFAGLGKQSALAYLDSLKGKKKAAKRNAKKTKKRAAKKATRKTGVPRYVRPLPANVRSELGVGYLAKAATDRRRVLTRGMGRATRGKSPSRYLDLVGTLTELQHWAEAQGRTGDAAKVKRDITWLAGKHQRVHMGTVRLGSIKGRAFSPGPGAIRQKRNAKRNRAGMSATQLKSDIAGLRGYLAAERRAMKKYKNTDKVEFYLAKSNVEDGKKELAALLREHSRRKAMAPTKKAAKKTPVIRRRKGVTTSLRNTERAVKRRNAAAPRVVESWLVGSSYSRGVTTEYRGFAVTGPWAVERTIAGYLDMSDCHFAYDTGPIEVTEDHVHPARKVVEAYAKKYCRAQQPGQQTAKKKAAKKRNAGAAQRHVHRHIPFVIEPAKWGKYETIGVDTGPGQWQHTIQFPSLRKKQWQVQRGFDSAAHAKRSAVTQIDMVLKRAPHLETFASRQKRNAATPGIFADLSPHARKVLVGIYNGEYTTKIDTTAFSELRRARIIKGGISSEPTVNLWAMEELEDGALPGVRSRRVSGRYAYTAPEMIPRRHRNRSGRVVLSVRPQIKEAERAAIKREYWKGTGKR